MSVLFTPNSAAPPEAGGPTGAAFRAAQVVLGAALTLSFFHDRPAVGALLALLAGLTLLLLLGRSWRSLHSRRLPAAVGLFTTWAVVSWSWSAAPDGSVFALVSLVAAVITGVGAGLVLTLGQIGGTALGVVKIVVVATLLSVVLFPAWATAPPPLDPVAGWHGLFTHKNGLGAFLVLAFIALALLPTRHRFAWLAAVGILLIGSQSSTAVAICALIAVVLVLRSVLVGTRSPAARTAVMGSTATLLVGLVLATTQRPELALDALGRGSTLSGRTEIWSAVARRVSERPLVGWGWGGVWRDGTEPTLSIWREARFEAFYAHNGYLDVLLQVGAVGLVLLLVALIRIVWHLRSQLGRSAPMWATLTALALAVSALSESAPFTGGTGLVLISALSTAALNVAHAAPPGRGVEPFTTPSHPHVRGAIPARTTGPRAQRNHV